MSSDSEPLTSGQQATEIVLTETRGTNFVVTINRPEVRNAIDGPTAAALVRAFRAFEADDALAIAILTGAGGTFCSGADLTSLADNTRMPRVAEDGAGPLGVTRMLLNKPVLAAVEGYAVAGGLELALWCDLRVAAEDAVFGVYCRRWGVPLVDGGTIRLPRLIGHSHALDMILTGRGVSGQEALMMGLANRIVPRGSALEVALAIASDLARFPQQCLRSDRLSAYEQWSLSMQDALRNETRRGLEVITSGETAQGARRFAAGYGRHGSASDIPSNEQKD
ncbi:MAG: crotonase/enoyl-CoA hydratase family protein [Ktedonobacteraceae bacterium]